MKVNLTAEMKKFITVAEMPAVKKVMRCANEDECTLTDLARVAARLVFDDNAAMIIECKSEDCQRISAFGTLSTRRRETLTCGLNLSAFSEYRSSFIIAGVYLTDLWQLTTDNADEIKSHMYIRQFKEVNV